MCDANDIGVPGAATVEGPSCSALRNIKFEATAAIISAAVVAFEMKPMPSSPVTGRLWPRAAAHGADDRAERHPARHGPLIHILVSLIVRHVSGLSRGKKVRNRLSGMIPAWQRSRTEIPSSLGWQVGSLNDERLYFKEGGGGGFHCMMRLYPSSGIGTVLMTNATGLNVRILLDRTDSAILERIRA